MALYKFTDTPANQGLSTWTASGTNAFPADKTYSGCTKPTGATGKLLRNAYVAWKAKFVVADGSNQRVLSPEIDGPNSNVTVSEGIGYGMLMAAYMGDKALFDGLLGYWKAHRSAQSMLMTWKIPRWVRVSHRCGRGRGVRAAAGPQAMGYGLRQRCLHDPRSDPGQRRDLGQLPQAGQLVRWEGHDESVVLRPGVLQVLRHGRYGQCLALERDWSPTSTPS